MQFDFESIDARARYKLLGAAITPRPIAWVSTLGENGEPNAAPFSFFNAFGEDPPIVGFSILHRSERDRKDTGENVRREREFVVNLVGESNLAAMNVTAIDFPPQRSEFAEAGLVAAPSSVIRTPRIAASPVSFECRLFDIIALGPSRSLVLGRIVAMHVDDDAVIDAERAYIDTRKLRLIGRGEANTYVRTHDVVRLPAIPLQDWDAHATHGGPR
ncbi:flavin reductase family protein [Burkholderia gladioli]|uniref:flavin reductase family protein n=1 Tax=Burkholderia gladioli TaxID=28095 RepID=UPI000CFF7CDF|nr:flavin reductase family protein [Burkholderia gladioli]MBU9325882.1 flavin reductase family protein [Burkholderia gladioli]MDN7755124.1 flavin reductase family protein [Burkholderia gladioli]PRH37666.1 flavin reductase family protein [Burkholderia gladioli]